MEDVGYHQANLFNDIVSHMSGLPFTYPPQDPAYALVPKFGYNHCSNRPTNPSSQRGHRFRIQYPNPDTNQCATDPATTDTDA